MRLTRPQIAERIAQDIPDKAYVNLGIGVPTLVSDYLPDDRQIVLHTENGMLGMGRAATENEIDLDLINAGKIFVTEELGAAYFHHADSFAMMRGGHIDYCVMGAYQVSARGDLANWRTDSPRSIPGVGGAMDLAVGAKHVYVVMDLFSKSGECKLVEACTYPLTGAECVERVYTDVAVFELTRGNVRVLEIFDDLDLEQLSAIMGLPLIDARPTLVNVMAGTP
ncbi:3-oxoacid CoA-transferase subunit B [Cryobacterium sp. TMS1-20-1]|uniref:3-oxoacid CoA-transferase subunit B n=1 Tax=Cryobacterium sp. TMS1-20-1 TaxID=1259223 RepID=UPI00106CE880|nr:3-oxoacid CoA-transferase subunit B [Cryobacterium sp. TMS1-20-1]TFC80558.1 3-oxoacid CoA-transferase subunit B [Cryobacterium sp. TMS1-20-1]